MPLDTGAVANDFGLSWAAEQDVAVQAPTLDDGPHIGAALRLIREFSGRSLEDLALTTRIRRHYLHSIEVLNLDQLPSRPFTIGYVRAYALALGLDGDRAVARFRRDAPDPDEPLRAPVGVRREADPRLMLVLICGLVVAGGILTWNFVERAISRKPPPPPAAAAPLKPGSAAPPEPLTVAVGVPLPPPQESTTPKPYYPPGMAKSLADSGSSVAATAAATATAADQATAEGQPQAQLVGAPFVAAGEVFGDAAPADSIILQARQPSSITVHRPDGAIDFARFLAAGQAYRAPLIKGWKVEVSEPASVDVFVGGRLQGPMPAPAAAITDLAKADAPAH
jgi:cytoskeletal protein RodZ